MPELTVNVTEQQLQRLDNILNNWEVIQTDLKKYIYAETSNIDQDLNLVSNIRQKIAQVLANQSQ